MNVLTLIALITVFTAEASLNATKGPISHSMGNTGRATILATESIYLNPAFVSLARGYHLGMGYYNQEIESTRANSLNLSVTDATQSTAFPAAISVVRSDESQFKSTNYALALGRAMRRWAWGLSYRYTSFESLQNGKKQIANRVDIGTLFMATDSISIGVVAGNLIEDKKLDEAYQSPRELAAGMTFQFQNQFRLQSDITRFFLDEDDTRGVWDYGFGVDTKIQEFLSFRLGWNKNEYRDLTLATTGLAFSGPRLGLNYAFSKGIGEKQPISHRVDFSLPF